MDHPQAPPADLYGGNAPGRGAEDQARSGITERNGIWVLTIGGVWRGDYRKRAHAEAEQAKQERR